MGNPDSLCQKQGLSFFVVVLYYNTMKIMVEYLTMLKKKFVKILQKFTIINHNYLISNTMCFVGNSNTSNQLTNTKPVFEH